MPKLRIEHLFLSLVAILAGVGTVIFSGAFVQQANVVTTTKDARLLTAGNGVSINDVLLSFRLHEGEMRDLLNRAANFNSSKQVSDYIDDVTNIYSVLLDQVQRLYNAPFEVIVEMRQLLSSIDNLRDVATDFMRDDQFFFDDDLVRELNRMNRRMDGKSSSIQELLLFLNPLAFQASINDLSDQFNEINTKVWGLSLNADDVNTEDDINETKTQLRRHFSDVEDIVRQWLLGGNDRIQLQDQVGNFKNTINQFMNDLDREVPSYLSEELDELQDFVSERLYDIGQLFWDPGLYTPYTYFVGLQDQDIFLQINRIHSLYRSAVHLRDDADNVLGDEFRDFRRDMLDIARDLLGEVEQISPFTSLEGFRMLADEIQRVEDALDDAFDILVVKGHGFTQSEANRLENDMQNILDDVDNHFNSLARQAHGTMLKEARLQEAYDPVNFVLVNNIMSMKADGLFHENDNVSKLELISAIIQAQHIDPTQETSPVFYDDVPALWEQTVALGVRNGWVFPRSIYTFGLTDYVTRAQGLFAVMQAYGLPTYPAGRPQTFVDVLPEMNFIELARQIDLVNGIAPTLFAPDQAMTRYELASILMRAAGLTII